MRVIWRLAAQALLKNIAGDSNQGDLSLMERAIGTKPAQIQLIDTKLSRAVACRTLIRCEEEVFGGVCHMGAELKGGGRGVEYGVVGGGRGLRRHVG